MASAKAIGLMYSPHPIEQRYRLDGWAGIQIRRYPSN